MNHSAILFVLFVVVSFTVTAQSCTYTERYGGDGGGVLSVRFRPNSHYTPCVNWINDPNGLVYRDGVYHMFYQYNPQDSVPQFDKMSWGHAVSTDLVHWKEMPIALLHDKEYAIFSGSAVIDIKNTSGLATPQNNPPIIAIFTQAFTDKPNIQAQGIAVTTTSDATVFKYYPSNPVLDVKSNSFRDPKVSWYGIGASDGHWVMVVARSDRYSVEFYTSNDLIHWSYASTFKVKSVITEEWECPDLLHLHGDDIWLLTVNLNPTFTYIAGAFNGTHFTAYIESAVLKMHDYGPDYYAAVTYNNIPQSNPETGPVVIQVGWLSNWKYGAVVPTSPWRGAMSLPRNLRYDKTMGALLSTPDVGVLKVLHGKHMYYSQPFVLEHSTAKSYFTNCLNFESGAPSYHIRMSFSLYKQYPLDFGIAVKRDDAYRTLIGYHDNGNGTVYVDRSRSSANYSLPPSFFDKYTAPIPYSYSLYHLTLDIIVDVSTIEVFVDDGVTTLSAVVYGDGDGVEMYCNDGSVVIDKTDVWLLNRLR